MGKQKARKPTWTQVTVKLTPTFVERVDRHAAAMGLSRDELLREAAVVGLAARYDAWRESEQLQRREAKKQSEARRARARRIVQSVESRPARR